MSAALAVKHLSLYMLITTTHLHKEIDTYSSLLINYDRGHKSNAWVIFIAEKLTGNSGR